MRIYTQTHTHKRAKCRLQGETERPRGTQSATENPLCTLCTDGSVYGHHQTRTLDVLTDFDKGRRKKVYVLAIDLRSQCVYSSQYQVPSIWYLACFMRRANNPLMLVEISRIQMHTTKMSKSTDNFRKGRCGKRNGEDTKNCIRNWTE